LVEHSLDVGRVTGSNPVSRTMKILAIETSCDETAIAILNGSGDIHSPSFKILGNALMSQIDIHKEYGGVYPSLARREHAKNLIPILIKALKDAGLYKEKTTGENHLDPALKSRLEEIFRKEPELLIHFLEIVPRIEVPNIDLIAVTEGPGLAPALWVGVNFADGLRAIWNKPALPINHMEGHIWSTLLNDGTISFPSIALLVSGGHTELVYVKNFGNFEIIGKTRDDAVGEAYDKVARLLGLPYPGGPEISRLAENHRQSGRDLKIVFTEPMANSSDFDFSYSGLKTAVLYKLKEFPVISTEIKEEIARAFEEAAIGALISKTKRAIDIFEAKNLIVGGGVIANNYLRSRLAELVSEYDNLALKLPEKELSTDNAVMIGMCAWLKATSNPSLLTDKSQSPLQAKGNLSF
jgi:N6-L-threonylcarbamoyladenine synthase